MSHAYPVLELGVEEDVGAALEWLAGFENLALLGRAATFRYVHVHDLVRESTEHVLAIRRAPVEVAP
ncbi:MAG: hypothetical protein R3F34_15945 [Planctomycetota bacterium]